MQKAKGLMSYFHSFRRIKTLFQSFSFTFLFELLSQPPVSQKGLARIIVLNRDKIHLIY
jgi:hypothetical protein